MFCILELLYNVKTFFCKTETQYCIFLCKIINTCTLIFNIYVYVKSSLSMPTKVHGSFCLKWMLGELSEMSQMDVSQFCLNSELEDRQDFFVKPGNFFSFKFDFLQCTFTSFKNESRKSVIQTYYLSENIFYLLLI